MTAPVSTTSARKARAKSVSRPLKISIAAGAIAAGGVVSALVGGQIWLESYLQGEAFRQQLQARLEARFHAQVELSRIKRSGTSLYLDSLEATGLAEAAFAKVHLSHVRADLNLSGLWQRTWRIERLDVQRAQLELKPAAPASSPALLPDAKSSAPPPSNGLPNWLLALLPNRTEVLEIKVDQTDLDFGSVRVRHSRCLAKPTPTDWELTAENGDISLPPISHATLQRATLVLRPDHTILRNARVLLQAGGETSLSGEFSRSSGADLRAHLDNIPIDPFLNAWWKGKIKGLVQGDLRFQKSPQTAPDGDLSGTLQLTGGRLEALPLFSQLDTFLGSPRFRSVPLKTARVSLLKSGTRSLYRDVDVDGDGLVRVQGAITSESDRLQGQMQLGLSPSLIQWLPGARSVLFKDQRDGYLWVPFDISGTVDTPSENLTSKLAESGKDAVLQAVQSVLPTPSQLPSPEKAKEAAKGAIDALRSIIPGQGR